MYNPEKQRQKQANELLDLQIISKYTYNHKTYFYLSNQKLKKAIIINPIIDTILSRRSTRSYQNTPIPHEMIETILTSAIWAPSGNNLQPWKFCVISEDTNLLKQISALTVYNTWVKTAPCLIAVFLDAKDALGVPKIHMKHIQAIGAAIQNVLLSATSLGLGTCWIGEIIKNEATLKKLLKVPSNLEFMGIITLGYPNKDLIRTKRKNLEESILSWK